MIPLSSKERVCDESGEFSTDYIGDFNVDLHTLHMTWLRVTDKLA